MSLAIVELASINLSVWVNFRTMLNRSVLPRAFEGDAIGLLEDTVTVRLIVAELSLISITVRVYLQALKRLTISPKSFDNASVVHGHSALSVRN